MSEVKEVVRTKSQKLLGMFETALNLPVTLERQLSREDGEKNILSRAISTRKASKKEEEEYESGFNGEAVSMEGMVQYEDLVQMLSCVQCGELCCPPTTQCKKGHLYCSDCKAKNRTCKVCKQMLLDTPNMAFDKLLSFIALPCKFRSRGCTELQFLHQKSQHQTLCRFRPVPCQYSDRGCEAVFSYKDICWHHKKCSHVTQQHPPQSKPDRPASAPNTPCKRKPSKPANSLRAQIKEARERRNSKSSLTEAVDIEPKINIIEAAEEFKDNVDNNKESLNTENSAKSGEDPEVPKLPTRKKTSNK